MRKRVVVITAALFIIVGLVVGGFYLYARNAVNAIPRSKALNRIAHPSTDGATNILLLGLDSRRDNNGNDIPRALLDTMHVGSSSSIGGYNTNTMILIHVPANGSQAIAISIPRDDFVAVPGYGMRKIKEAYGIAKYYGESKLVHQGIPNPAREQLSRDIGRAATIATITKLLNIPIDHFAEVNLVSFYDLSKALGGVQVCLKHAVNDSQYSGAIFPAGLQIISGVDALKFVRQRHGLANGDLDRTHRQQAFITGVITKLRGQGAFTDIGKVQSLIDVAKKDVVIDNKWDVLGFLPQAKNLTGGHITFYTLPIDHYDMRNGQSVNIIDNVLVKKFVHGLFYPQKKSASPTTSPSPITPTSALTPTSTLTLTPKVGHEAKANGVPVSGGTIPCVN
jgi:LCP family protein required for cell wall assembly